MINNKLLPDIWKKHHNKFDSTLTIYGEEHDVTYQHFLSNYVSDLLKSERKHIIIIEANSDKIEEERDQIINKNKQRDTVDYEKIQEMLNTDRGKRLLAKYRAYPIRYFAHILIFDIIFPNITIVCSDIQIADVLFTLEKIYKKTKTVPNDTIDNDLLQELKYNWTKQFEKMELEDIENTEYQEMKDDINFLLDSITVDSLYIDIKDNIKFLRNIFILLPHSHIYYHTFRNFQDKTDISIFVGKLHLPKLIENFDKKIK